MKESGKSCVAIVGGNGFVGSSLAKHLSNLFTVRVLDVNSRNNSYGDFRACDIRDKQELIKNLSGCDLVINAAIVQVPRINAEKRLGYEVNVRGLQNVCEAVESINSIKGLIHTGSWHVFGERDFRGVLDEEFGFRPDKIENRAKLYALCKIAQESIARIFAESSAKCYGVVRLGTVLGEDMPTQTAASMFIRNGLRGEPITPFKHTQHRPMLYVDIRDVCRGYEVLASEILDGTSLVGSARLVNLLSPTPLTVIEVARVVQEKIIKATLGRTRPQIKLIDQGIKQLYTPTDKKLLRVDVTKARQLLKPGQPINARQSIDRLIKVHMQGP